MTRSSGSTTTGGGATAGRNRYSSRRRLDPTALLARGYTARYLHGTAIAGLNAEEMDRDIRHIVAYTQAADRYHQLTYAATNNLHPNSNGVMDATATDAASSSSKNKNAAAIAAQLQLPVTIDPDSETRAALLARRIQRAEAVREELEQHYVALRAHYVVTTQQLHALQPHDSHGRNGHTTTTSTTNANDSSTTTTTSSTPKNCTIAMLQATLDATAATTAGARARLQLARDCWAALQVRSAVLASNADAAAPPAATTTVSDSIHENNDENDPNGEVVPPLTDAVVAMDATSSEQANTANASTDTTTINNNNSSTSCPLTAAWLAIDDDCKKLHKQQQQILLKATTLLSKKAMPWSCPLEPATPQGVPLLLSALSTVPEKSVAMACPDFFGSQDHDLVWLPSHLPSTDDLEKEPDIDALADQVDRLERDLAQERDANQKLLTQTANARQQHDEWVAMISLVRQETEAVLHRHTILLESDEITLAAANAAAARDDEEEDGEEEDDDGRDNGDEEDDGTHGNGTGDAGAAEGDATTTEDWDTQKRNAPAEPPNESPTRKRRKV